MSRTPDVAVIIPARNAEPTLSRQLASLAAQIQPPAHWEILVSDNGSADGTGSVVSRWAFRGLPVRLIDASDRRGAAHARNIGATRTEAPIIVFCDSDDEVTDTWLRELVRALDRFGIVGGRSDTRSLNPRGAWTYPREVPKNHPFVPAASMAIRRHHFEELGGFDERLADGGEDIDFCYRALQLGLTVGVAEDAVYRSRARVGTRAVYAQAARDGRGTVQLVHLRGHEIVPRRSAMVLVFKVCWLLSRAPLTAVSVPYRRQWIYRVGHLVGLIQGWRRFRTLAW